MQRATSKMEKWAKKADEEQKEEGRENGKTWDSVSMKYSQDSTRQRRKNSRRKKQSIETRTCRRGWIMFQIKNARNGELRNNKQKKMFSWLQRK